MKKICRILLPLAGLALLASPAARADEPSAPPSDRRERREGRMEDAKKMAKELNLTSDQQIQVEAIHKQTAEAMKAVRSDASLSEDQKRAKGRELMKSSMDQVQALLTPEQKAKAKELRKNGRRGPGDHPPGDHPPGDKPPAN